MNMQFPSIVRIAMGISNIKKVLIAVDETLERTTSYVSLQIFASENIFDLALDLTLR